MDRAEPTERADRDPETLEIFIEESRESLERIEGLLLAAEEGRAPADMLDVLFRDIHTIKGTSGFLALPITQELSHAAEDLLALLRSRELTATPRHFTLLVGVVDALRVLVDRVQHGDDEGEYDISALVSELRRAAGPGGAAAAPEPPAAKSAPTAIAPPPPPAAIATPPAAIAAPPEPIEPEVQPEPEPPPKKLGEILIEQNSITPEQLQEALEVQRSGREVSPGRGEGADGTVRVSVQVLDRLMNLVGELVLARNQMVQIVRTVSDANVNTQAAAQRLSLVTSDLQEQIMKTRMQPIARVFERIPRMVRDLCTVTGKQVKCEIAGNATEIDKALVEATRDPVMHIVRNAIDHGIEPAATRRAAGKSPSGRINVRANHEGGMVYIEIQDDGSGMDPQRMREHAVRKQLLTAAQAERLSDREAIDLVFRPGFSTAPKVTNVSGRGVGMDVVRTHVERAGGQVELDTVVGKGTTVRLKMPLTLAIIPALLVSAGGQRFAIPQVNLLELLYLDEDQTRSAIEYVRGAAIYRLRGEVLPLVRLATTLQMPAGPSAAPLDTSIVVVGIGGRRFGLIVDSIQDTEEIVIKPLHSQFKRLACYAGATVLGDGGVALILDVAGVAVTANIDLAARRGNGAEAAAHDDGTGPQPMLVLTAGAEARCAVPLSMVSRLEVIAPDKIERIAGQEVLQYRGTIIPVIRPESLLPLGEQQASAEQQLVVFDFGRPVAMAVSRIIDVVELERKSNQAADAAPYTVGKAVIFGHTTLFIDVYAIVRKLAPEFVRDGVPPRRSTRILVVDDSAAMCAVMGSYLSACDVEVVEVSSGEAALAEARRGGTRRFDAVVTDLEMAGMDGFSLIEMLARELPQLPVIAWTSHEEPAVQKRVVELGARACVHKLERESLMSALAACGVVLAPSGATQGKERAA